MDFGQSAAAFKRAKWLAELAAAIDSADAAAKRLILEDRHAAEAQDLLQQLHIVKREIADLRLGGWRAPAREIGSKWIKLRDD
jgi:hypothetical protein